MIVLDTHALIWWVNGDHQALSSAALKAIESESQQGEIIISTISSWEIAMLIEKNRIALAMELNQWLATVADLPNVRFVSVDNHIAVHSAALPGEFHKDPADRMIVATARLLSAPIISADEKIRAYPHVKTIW
jgi:PIN domain nuclease of toxin-antitoxin system